MPLLLAACSSGEGGDGESREPTEEEVKKAEDALAGEEQAVIDAVEQAIADLEARIPAIDPCEADPAQLASLYGPLVVLQQTGDLGEAYQGRLADTLAPVSRALARAHSNGQLEGSGISGEDITNWARGTNVDPSSSDWMVDERCTERWRIETRWDGTIIAATSAEAVSMGHVDFSVYQGGPISVSGPLEATFETKLPSDACSVNWVVTSEPLEVKGRWEFAPNAFVVDVTFGAQDSTGTISCPGAGALPPFTHSEAASVFPVTLDATDGFTQTIGGEVIPGANSRFTFTVSELD